MSWLETVARTDEVSPAEAVSLFVESGLASAAEWVALGTKDRARLIASRRLAAGQTIADRGQDLAAAISVADLDGGRQAARVMAHHAARGVAHALAARREKGAGAWPA